MDQIGDHFYPLIWHNQLQYHWWVYSDSILRYQILFLIFINSSKITSAVTIPLMVGCWHSLLISKSVFLFLNLTKVSLDQKCLKFDTIAPTLFIIIFCSNNKPVWIMISSILFFLFFQALEKLDMEVLDFWLFKNLPILEWFSTWFLKHAIIPVHTYFHIPIAFWSSLCPFFQDCSYQDNYTVFEKKILESKCRWNEINM